MYLSQFNLQFLIVLALLAMSCSQEDKVDESGPLWLATTGMAGEMLQAMARPEVTVEVLMGPGVDPHLFKASQGDLQKLRNASLVLYNGHHLEGKLSEVLESISERKSVLALAELPDPSLLLRVDASGSLYDPHIWMDVILWHKAGLLLLDSLKASYPQYTDTLKGKAYLDSLLLLNKEIETQIQSLPESHRILITAHDAFAYYGKRYGLEVYSLQGISTLSDFGLKDLNQLADFITSKKVKAVFMESAIPPRSIQALIETTKSKGHLVEMGGSLYSDAMGEQGTSQGTYMGMIRYNTQTIVNALQP